MNRVFDTLPTFFETERNVVAFDDILYIQCIISYNTSIIQFHTKFATLPL